MLDETTTGQSIIWRRLDRPGHEFAKLFFSDSCWNLDGTAVFMHDKQYCCLDYWLKCNSQWQTLSGRITGWVGEKVIEIEIAVKSNRHWTLNGQARPEVKGCIDIDLNFSPVTNLLPIRRLNLGLGEKGEVRAAWLRFPSFELEPLEQSYRRVNGTTYRYESRGGRFVTELQVNESGLVTLYPNFWQIEGDA